MRFARDRTGGNEYAFPRSNRRPINLTWTTNTDQIILRFEPNGSCEKFTMELTKREAETLARLLTKLTDRGLKGRKLVFQ
jgi:hypothetical protein